jgi:hypothetical protein
MGRSGQIPLDKIAAMLEGCSPGARIVRKKHHFWVLDARGGIFRGLPLGTHGATNPKIEDGHVRSMARHLGFWECAKEHFGW